jgi:hypothetical protein
MVISINAPADVVVRRCGDKAMPKCWAKSMGNCSEEQSGEHYLSRGLFTAQTVIVGGFSWLKDGPKELPVARVITNCLCKRHNELLSELDKEAIHLSKNLAEIRRLHDVRTALKKQKNWTIRRYTVKGFLIERWMAKLLVGLLYAINQEGSWHLYQADLSLPPETVVRAIFGLEQFQSPMGFYFAHAIGDNTFLYENFDISLRFHPEDDKFVGALIRFRGIQFFLCFTQDEGFHFRDDDKHEFGPTKQMPQYRIRKVEFLMTNERPSQILEFKW